jgi:mono/diheme cytochrome c family protein
MRHGRRPDGANYFPAFPYPSFTKITDADLRDLFAYLRTLPQSAQPSRPHDLGFPFSWRFLVTFWKWLYFTPGPFASIPGASEVVNRGAYLVQALGHCGECHTPRNFLGGPKRDRLLAGGETPEGKGVSNLTPGGPLKKWRDSDIRDFLFTGTNADGDVPAEAMAEVIRNTTSLLTPGDMAAMIAYLRTVPPVADEPQPKKKK